MLSSITTIYDRLAPISPKLAGGALVALLLVLLSVLAFGLHFLWSAWRAGRETMIEPAVPTDPGEAAVESVAAARRQIEQVRNEVARRALSQDVEALAGDLAEHRYTIVVFGAGSSGKTAVINALLGGNCGATDPIVGTTRESVEHTYVIDGFNEGKLRLVDTPGLSEIGEGGLMREERARELAAGADLLLFVVDQDLRDIEFRPLAGLARLGKRSLLVFNKRDLYSTKEHEEIARALCERAKQIGGPVDVVSCAADPAPVHVRQSPRTETGETLSVAGAATLQKLAPDVTELADRIAALLRDQGRSLLARNVLLRAASVANRARDLIHLARRDEAARIVTRFQWITAGVMFVNPVPGLGALAAAAINYQMVMEIAKVFGVSLTVDSAKRLAGELAQVLLKMGVVNVATEILGKALKATLVGYVAGGAIEAVAGAYLSRLAGETFIDYFAHDQNWGDGGMQGAIERRFQLTTKREFVAEFIKEAAERVLSRKP